MPSRRAYLSLADCEVCRRLRDVERGLRKHGWPEDDKPLPAAAGRLTPDPARVAGSRKTVQQRCPVCGMRYEYVLDYEYFANGAEDDETLRRLTPTQARDQMSKAEYDWWIAHLEADRDHPDPRTRAFARRALADHGER